MDAKYTERERNELRTAFAELIKETYIKNIGGDLISSGDASFEELSKEYDEKIIKMVSDGFNLDQLMDEVLFNHIGDEVEWSRNHPHTQSYRQFTEQVAKLTTLENTLSDDMLFHKMRFSYTVTLMESCLSEMLKSITLSEDLFKKNAMTSIKGLNDSTVNVKDLFGKDTSSIIDTAIVSFLSSEVLYHNLPKVSTIYAKILGKPFPNMPAGLSENVHKYMRLRHDIVHRNGKKISGEDNDITPHILNTAIENVALYVHYVYEYLNSVLVEKTFEKN